MSAEQAFLAATAIVDAFGAHDTQRYFEGFAEDATFLFHNAPERLMSRKEYEALWAEWEAGCFQVLGCRSLEPEVHLVTDDVAVFTHRVRTRLEGEDAELRERETIVLRREPDGRWLAVHEHLSPEPGTDSD